jgi:putative transposase
MTRLRGWASKGERLVDKVPHGHWKTVTFLAALRNDRIEALCLFDGPTWFGRSTVTPRSG